MAYFSRLIIAFVALSFSAYSFADTCPSFYVAAVGNPSKAPMIWDTPGGDVGNLSAICAAYYPGAAAEGPPTLSQSATHYISACGKWVGSTWTRIDNSVSITKAKRFQGPDGQFSPTDPGTCASCAPGQTRDPETGVCVTSCPSAGTTEGDSSNAYTTDSKVPSNNLCIGSCSWSAGGVVPSVCANGKCYYYGPFTSNGTSCTGEGGAPPPEEPDPVPPDDAQCVAKGQCPGTFNGTFMCVPCGSKEGTTSESGSSSSESTDSSGAPSGSSGPTNTTKETTANCTGNSCNVTTTTHVTNPDGSTSTTTETETKPQADFCKSNPGHVVCKGEDEGTFGGSCSAGFQCSGDAVQCAQAEAAWKSACASDVSGMTDQINTGTAAMAAGAASGLGIPGGSDAFDLGSRLSEVPLFGSSGGCPSDVSVNVGGTSYTIAFSSMCPQLQVLGVALMAFAYLVAGFIVFRGDRS